MKRSLPRPPIPAVFNKATAHVTKKISRALPKIIRHLPEPPFILQKKIADTLLKNLMAEQIETGDFDFLQDKWLKICVNDLEFAFFLTFNDQKLQLSRQMSQEDVSFSGDAKEFILLASRREDPDTLFFQRRLVIEGDTELGLNIKNAIDAIDFDNWPAWLNQGIQKMASMIVDTEVDAATNISFDKTIRHQTN